MSFLKSYSTLILVILCFITANAQRKTITGIVQDANSEEPIPFASISFRNTTIGKLSDSSGHFSFNLDKWPSDTLEITNVGYQPYRYIIDLKKDVLEISINLERGTY